ncbi:hypothetical protein ACA910_010768 [Epithemia clementina (nom. ined.)]
MPTLPAIGVHPEACARLIVQSKSFSVSPFHAKIINNRPANPTRTTTAATNDGDNDEAASELTATSKPRVLHRMPTPIHVLRCPISSLQMMDKTLSKSYPVPLVKAAQLRREIAQALTVHHHPNGVGVEDKRSESHGNFNSGNKLECGGPLRKRTRRATGYGRLVSMREQIQQRDDIMQWSSRVLSTGCPNLDLLLKPTLANGTHKQYHNSDDPLSKEPSKVAGGIPFGFVTHIQGPPESGKTQFICHLCKQSISSDTKTTVWMICSSSVVVHASRLAQVVETMNPPNLTKQQAIMERTIMRMFGNEWELLAVLSEIEIRQLQQSQSSPHVIAIDSFASHNFDSRLTKRISGRLRYMARRFSFAVIVVESTIVSDGDRTFNYLNRRKNAVPISSSDIRLGFTRVGQRQLKGRAEKQDLSFIVRVVLEQCTMWHGSSSPHSMPMHGKRNCLLTVQMNGVKHAD